MGVGVGAWVVEEMVVGTGVAVGPVAATDAAGRVMMSTPVREPVATAITARPIVSVSHCRRLSSLVSPVGGTPYFSRACVARCSFTTMYTEATMRNSVISTQAINSRTAFVLTKSKNDQMPVAIPASRLSATNVAAFSLLLRVPMSRPSLASAARGSWWFIVGRPNKCPVAIHRPRTTRWYRADDRVIMAGGSLRATDDRLNRFRDDVQDSVGGFVRMMVDRSATPRTRHRPPILGARRGRPVLPRAADPEQYPTGEEELGEFLHGQVRDDLMQWRTAPPCEVVRGPVERRAYRPG